MSKEVSTRSSGKPVTVHHTATMLAVGVVGAIVAFWVLSSLASLIYFIIKIGVLVVLVGGAFWLVSRLKRR